jgi:hypothetical protein
MVVTSNSSITWHCLSKQAHVMMIKPAHIIANTGATLVFVMEGTPYKNKRLTENPITILLPDGKKVTTMHICDTTILGLPCTLMGHIDPEMKMVSLLGIRVLCKAVAKLSLMTKNAKSISIIKD